MMCNIWAGSLSVYYLDFLTCLLRGILLLQILPDVLGLVKGLCRCGDHIGHGSLILVPSRRHGFLAIIIGFCVFMCHG
jgi:hypothetical protein